MSTKKIYPFLTSAKLADNLGFNPILATSFSEFFVLSDEWIEDLNKQKNKKKIIEKIIKKMTKSNFYFNQEVEELQNLI